MNKLSRSRIATASLFFIQGFSVVTWANRLPDIQRKFGFSDGELGLMLLLPPAAQLLMMAVSGNLVRRFGSTSIARIAALLLPMLLPVLAEVSTLPMLASAMFIFGMATNLSNIAANTQGLQVERLYEKSIMASFHGWWSIGGACAILIGMVLVRMGTSLRMNFLAAWIICLAIYGMNVWHLLSDEVSSPQHSKSVEEKTSLWSVPLMLFGLICFCSLGCEGSINNWITIYFQNVVHAPGEWTRLGYFVYMLAITCCRFSADQFARKCGAFPTLRVAAFLLFAGLLLVVSCPRLISASIGCLLIGLGTSAVLPLCYSILGKRYRETLPIALTIVNGISFTGFLLMPAVVGCISDIMGLRTAFVSITMLSVLLFILILLVERQEKGKSASK
jgi:MFS family permease